MEILLETGDEIPLWEAIFMTCLIGSFVCGAIFSTWLDPVRVYGLKTIWLVAIILTIFLI